MQLNGANCTETKTDLDSAFTYQEIAIAAKDSLLDNGKITADY